MTKFRSWLLLALAVLPLAPRARAQDLLRQKLVWAHNIPVFPLDIKSPQRKIYGAHYPLVLSDQPALRGADETIHEAQAEGIDGFAVDTFSGLQLIRPFYEAADRDHFLLAPCFDMAGLRLEEKKPKLLHAVETYCREAVDHPSCARQNGAFVVFMYRSAALPVQDWADIRATLKNEGLKVFWVGDISVNFDQVRPGVFPDQDNIRRQTLAYFSTYDMGYSFLAVPDQNWNTIQSVFYQNHKPFAGGMWPGYFRGVVSNKVIRPFGHDAQATALYRGYWQRQIVANVPWTEVATWNDYVEHTNLSADTSFNVSRGDITAWYAAQFKNQPSPFREARLYVTAPQALYLNQPSVAEALVLNPTNQPVPLRLRLLDGAGAPFGASVSGIAAPNSQVAITIPLNMTGVPAGHFLRAVASMGSGATSTSGAPILVYDTPSSPGNRVPVLYYSIPAQKALPGKVGLSISNGQAELSVSPGVRPRLVDLLHDQKLVKITGSVSVDEPVTLDEDPNLKTTDDNYTDAQDHGLYVGRVIDDQNRVGFSDPVFVSPARN